VDELKPDKDGKIHLKLNADDSALVVRVDGTIEVISHELSENENDNGYVGDVEDLNKTFSLVLALAASLEDEKLYDMIYDNLNKVLMKKWESLDDSTKDDIVKIRKRKHDERNNEEREEKDKRVDEFRDRMNRYNRKGYADERRRMMQDLHDEAEFMRKHGGDFSKSRKEQPKPKIKKPSLRHLKGIDWNPNDKSLIAHFKDFRADESPEDE
jgi:hypothetical protein